jgi:uncharacterized protein (TIGR00369 family)
MSAVPKDAVPRHDGAVQATSGEFAGWWTWTRDNFERNNGPFWHREEENGAIRCAFRVEKKHINGSDALHGGALMAFADYCLFALGHKVLDGRAVTLSFSCEFIDAAYEDELIEGHGEVVRAGRSIVFLRGTLSSAGRAVLTFSGTVKRITARPSVPQPA